MAENNYDGDYGMGQLDPAKEEAALIEAERIQPYNLSSHHPWGEYGQRWDEECDKCGRVTVVDNDSGLCRQCHEKRFGGK